MFASDEHSWSQQFVIADNEPEARKLACKADPTWMNQEWFVRWICSITTLKSLTRKSQILEELGTSR